MTFLVKVFNPRTLGAPGLLTKPTIISLLIGLTRSDEAQLLLDFAHLLIRAILGIGDVFIVVPERRGGIL